MYYNSRQSNPGFSRFLDGLIYGEDRTSNPGKGAGQKGKSLFANIISRPYIERVKDGYIPAPALPGKFLDQDLTRGKLELEREAGRLARKLKAKEEDQVEADESEKDREDYEEHSEAYLFASLEKYLKKVEEDPHGRLSGPDIDLKRMYIMANFLSSAVIPEALRMDDYAGKIDSIKPIYETDATIAEVNRYIKELKKAYDKVITLYELATGTKLKTLEEDEAEELVGHGYSYDEHDEDEAVEIAQAILEDRKRVFTTMAVPSTIKYTLKFLSDFKRYEKEYYNKDEYEAGRDAYKAGRAARKALVSTYVRSSPRHRKSFKEALAACVSDMVVKARR